MSGELIPFPASPLKRREERSRRYEHWNGHVRLRRTDAIDPEFQRDLDNAFHLAYPRDLAVDDRQGSKIFLRYRIGRRNWLTENEWVAHREIVGWIESGGQRIGAIQLDEWHPAVGIENDEFLDDMDSLSQASYNIGVVITNAWDLVDLSEAGPILEFSRLWMHPAHARESVWQDVMKALIRRRYAGKFSLLIHHAFPTEYEGEGAICDGKDSPFERRKRAMMRLYTRTMGVVPFPGEDGREGWMWKALNRHLPPPGLATDG